MVGIPTGSGHRYPPKVFWIPRGKFHRSTAGLGTGHCMVPLGLQSRTALFSRSAPAPWCSEESLGHQAHTMWGGQSPRESGMVLMPPSRKEHFSPWRHLGLGCLLPSPFAQGWPSWAETNQTRAHRELVLLQFSKYPSHTWALKDDPTWGEHVGLLHSSQACYYPQHPVLGQRERKSQSRPTN